MADGGPLRVAVICEARADQRTACGLADRVAQDSVNWLAPELLDAVRQWCGATPDAEFLAWKAIRSEADQRRIRAHGHFSSEAAEPDARAARLALLVARSYTPDVAAVLLIRDSDNDQRRLLGLRQAREAYAWPFQIVIGVAHTKRECWVLTAFCPGDENEKSRHAEVRKELGFDPCLHSHRLDAKPEDAKKNAKRVAAVLCPDGSERRLSEASLDLLRERGKENGLAEYLGELKKRYVPLFGAKRS